MKARRSPLLWFWHLLGRWPCLWLTLHLALVASCQFGGSGDVPYGPGVFPPPEGPEVVDVSVGWDHGCALQRDGTVRCWGSNEKGQHGTEASFGPPSAHVVPGLENVQDLASGTSTTCALLGDQTIRCWGSNDRGELGQQDLAPRTGPVAVPGLTDVVQLKMGGGTGCALRSNGTVWCWGVYDMALPYGANPEDYVGVEQVVDATDIVQISVYGTNGCGVRADGMVWCWNEAYPPRRSAYYHPSLRNVQTVHVGGSTVVATLTGGTGSWFTVSMYQEPPYMAQSSVYHTESLDQIADLCVGSAHLCFLRNGGTVFCRGNNSFGQAGAHDVDFPDGDVEITDINDAVSLECGSSINCVIHLSGAVSCWGENKLGALGNATNENSYRPVWVTL